ncbi:MAG: TRAP transporter small permease subunit [Gammaproteobacteria bacterium]
MSFFARFGKLCVCGIDALNEWIGRAVSWLTLAMVLTTFLIVVLRYAFNFGSVPLQESVSYMHGLVFMLGAAYTLKADGHVRVDIFYQRFGEPVRAWIDCLGVLFLLLPVAGFMLWSGWEYVADSWSIRESSSNSGGLPGIYLLKSTILVTAVLLILQGLSLFIRKLAIALRIVTNQEQLRHG